jgi:hypothetical protein
MLTVGLHERHVSTAWAISVVLGGNRRPTTGAERSTVREAQGDTNLPAKGRHLYRVEAELKLLVLRLFVSLIYRPSQILLTHITILTVEFANGTLLTDTRELAEKCKKNAISFSFETVRVQKLVSFILSAITYCVFCHISKKCLCVNFTQKTFDNSSIHL